MSETPMKRDKSKETFAETKASNVVFADDCAGEDVALAEKFVNAFLSVWHKCQESRALHLIFTFLSFTRSGSCSDTRMG